MIVVLAMVLLLCFPPGDGIDVVFDLAQLELLAQPLDLLVHAAVVDRRRQVAGDVMHQVVQVFGRNAQFTGTPNQLLDLPLPLERPLLLLNEAVGVLPLDLVGGDKAGTAAELARTGLRAGGGVAQRPALIGPKRLEELLDEVGNTIHVAPLLRMHPEVAAPAIRAVVIVVEFTYEADALAVIAIVIRHVAIRTAADPVRVFGGQSFGQCVLGIFLIAEGVYDFELLPQPFLLFAPELGEDL